MQTICWENYYMKSDNAMSVEANLALVHNVSSENIAFGLYKRESRCGQTF